MPLLIFRARRSDFVYMVPPFLAYYGVLTSNESLVTEAYNQIKLYRDHLRDTDANNLWKHVVLGSGIDEGHWSTGVFLTCPMCHHAPLMTICCR